MQAESILELKLRHLAKLEEMKIKRRAEGARGRGARELERTLESEGAGSKKLMRDEMLETLADKYGDARRTAIVEREAAQAIAETELVASEPVTVVLSERGWVRAAKGHEIDVLGLSYKSGDEFLAAARGTQQSARRVHRQHRPSVQRRRAHAAICAWSGRAVGRSTSIRRMARASAPC